MTSFISLLIKTLQDYWQYFIDKLPLLLLAIIVLIIFFVISHIGRKISLEVVGRLKDKGKIEITIVVGRIFRAGILVLGLVVAMGVYGIKLSALLTSLGLIGFALSFVLRDYIKDFLAGLIILTQRPFVISDEIKIGDFEGVVKAIEMRFTVIKTYDDRKVLISNSDVLNKAVVIATGYTRRRIDLEINFKELKSSSKLKDLIKEIRKTVRRVDGVEASSDIELFLDGIEDDKVKLKLSFWTKPEKDKIKIGRSEVIENVYWLLREKKVEGVKIV
ncbi:MAG: mechanosensitive ion channel [Parcubacteria group bacterium]|nr:mechanosensitive ion channel [Parcubacteria group bacterium]